MARLSSASVAVLMRRMVYMVVLLRGFDAFGVRRAVI